MIVKVVYFDEGTATDYIYILDGGKYEESKEKIVNKSTEMATKAEAKAKAKFKLFSFIDTSVEGAASAAAEREGKSILRKAISNTILTDYLALVESQKQKPYVRVFKSCMLYPYPQSFSFYKIITPYMIMTEGKVDVGSDIKINIALMDQALESGRGYYELIAEKRGVKSVLRFNIKAFRNNYSISDLVKMRLDYHAIEVGTVPVAGLTMESEFSQEQTLLSGFNLANNTPLPMLKVYDVILAGVER